MSLTTSPIELFKSPEKWGQLSNAERLADVKTVNKSWICGSVSLQRLTSVMLERAPQDVFPQTVSDQALTAYGLSMQSKGEGSDPTWFELAYPVAEAYNYCKQSQAISEKEMEEAMKVTWEEQGSTSERAGEITAAQKTQRKGSRVMTANFLRGLVKAGSDSYPRPSTADSEEATKLTTWTEFAEDVEDSQGNDLQAERPAWTKEERGWYIGLAAKSLQKHGLSKASVISSDCWEDVNELLSQYLETRIKDKQRKRQKAKKKKKVTAGSNPDNSGPSQPSSKEVQEPTASSEGHRTYHETLPENLESLTLTNVRSAPDTLDPDEDEHTGWSERLDLSVGGVGDTGATSSSSGYRSPTS